MDEKNQRKSSSVSIRVTPEQQQIIERMGLSPTALFNRGFDEVFLESRKELAQKNLEHYPTIKRLFEEDWILEKVSELRINEEDGVNGHGLAWMLSAHPDRKVLKIIEENRRKASEGNVDAGMMAFLQESYFYTPLLKLQELEENLKLLEKDSKIRSTLKKAKNEEQFWPTLSEIEVAAYFKKNGLLKQIEPLVGGKTPDLSIDLAGEETFLEVYTPELSNALVAAGKERKVIAMKNRAWGKIDDKLKQLPKGKSSVLVINRSFSEIDAINVEDAILGTLGLYVSKIPGKEPLIVRKSNGLGRERDLSDLKAIVLYKRVFDIRAGKKMISHGS